MFPFLAARRAAPAILPLVRTLVLGLGNPLLGDDAIGLRVAATVRERLAGEPGIVVREEKAGGLSLMDALTGYQRVILVDAVVTGGTPGAIRRMGPDELPTQRTALAHGIDLPGALELGRILGLPMPSEVRIVAIEAVRVLEFRDDMTPAVAAALEPAVEAVLEELRGAETAAPGDRSPGGYEAVDEGDGAEVRIAGSFRTEEKEFPIPMGEALVGRGETCGVQLPSPLVSRVHARVLAEAGRVLIEDARSTNGTWVNGTKVEQPLELEDGDEVAFGLFRVVFRRAGP